MKVVGIRFLPMNLFSPSRGGDSDRTGYKKVAIFFGKKSKRIFKSFSFVQKTHNGPVLRFFLCQRDSMMVFSHTQAALDGRDRGI